MPWFRLRIRRLGVRVPSGAQAIKAVNSRNVVHGQSDRGAGRRRAGHPSDSGLSAAAPNPSTSLGSDQPTSRTAAYRTFDHGRDLGRTAVMPMCGWRNCDGPSATATHEPDLHGVSTGLGHAAEVVSKPAWSR